MKVAARVLIAVILALYPLLVYIGLVQGNVRTLALLLLAVVVARFLVLSGLKSSGVQSWAIWGMTLLLLCVLSLVLVFDDGQYFLYYPIIMSGLFLTVFAASLLRPPTVIERLARVQEPDLPESGVRYTRKVTWVWCGFFVVNGSIAWATLFMPLEWWTLYNGLISYILMGLLFAGEFAVRQMVRQKSAGVE